MPMKFSSVPVCTLIRRPISFRGRSIARLYGIMGEVLREAIAMGGSSVRDYFAPDGTEGQYKRGIWSMRKPESPVRMLAGQ